MSNIIEFLGQMGQDARLRYATGNELEQALTRAQIEPALRAAVLAGDRRRLEVLLGAAGNRFCGVYVPDGDEESGPATMMKKDGRLAVSHASAASQAATA
jgi:hypothetical protein